MTEYQGEKKEYKQDRISIFHYNEQTGLYKTLRISPTDRNDGMFIGIRQGVKGTKGENISLMVNMQEAAFLILELQKLYNELKTSPPQ